MSGKKGKKMKGISLTLKEFLGPSSNNTVVVPVARSSWADESEGYDEDRFGPLERLVLPTAPRNSIKVDIDPSRIPDEPPYKVYVANLPFEVDDDEIAKFFQDLKVKSIRLPREGGGGRFKGFGYVEFETRNDLVEALSMNESTMSGRTIRVDIAEGEGGNQRRGFSDRGGRGDEDRPDRSEGVSDWRAAPRDTASTEGGRDGYSPSRGSDFDRDRRDEGRGFGDRDRGFGDRDRGFGDRDRGFGDRDRGFGDRDRDRGFSDRDRDRGFGDRDRDRGFGDRDRGFGDRDRDRGFGDRDRDRGFGDRDRDRGFGDRDRGFGDRDRGFGDRDRGFRDRYQERGYDRDRGYRDRYGDRSYDRGRLGGGSSRYDDDRSGGDPWRREREGGRQDTPRERPKLQLIPRSAGGGKEKTSNETSEDISKAGEDTASAPAPTTKPAASSSGSSIFGSARPVDTASREKEIEQKLSTTTKEAPPAPKKEVGGGGGGNIFGSAKPVDTAARERQIEEKLRKMDMGKDEPRRFERRDDDRRDYRLDDHPRDGRLENRGERTDDQPHQDYDDDDPRGEDVSRGGRDNDNNDDGDNDLRGERDEGYEEDQDANPQNSKLMDREEVVLNTTNKFASLVLEADE